MEERKTNAKRTPLPRKRSWRRRRRPAISGACPRTGPERTARRPGRAGRAATVGAEAVIGADMAGTAVDAAASKAPVAAASTPPAAVARHGQAETIRRHLQTWPRSPRQVIKEGIGARPTFLHQHRQTDTSS